MAHNNNASNNNNDNNKLLLPKNSFIVNLQILEVLNL